MGRAVAFVLAAVAGAQTCFVQLRENDQTCESEGLTDLDTEDCREAVRIYNEPCRLHNDCYTDDNVVDSVAWPTYPFGCFTTHKTPATGAEVRAAGCSGSPDEETTDCPVHYHKGRLNTEEQA